MIWLKRLGFMMLLILPALSAAVWSSYPALRALFATETLVAPALNESDWEDRERLTDARRQIQKHFSQHEIYVPIEDIILASPLDGESGQLALLMQKACGRGRLYVWIPIRFRVPILGEKVVEWCWKPRKTDV